MTCIASKGLGVASAMNADALFIKFNPNHTRWIVRPGWQYVKGRAALAFVEHFEIVAKVGQFRDSLHGPMSNWRRSLLRTYGNRKCGDKFLSRVNFENILLGADEE